METPNIKRELEDLKSARNLMLENPVYEGSKEEFNDIIDKNDSTKQDSNALVIQLNDLEIIDIPLKGTKPDTKKYISHSFEDETIISFGDHSFMSGLLAAYKGHKSITLSPDIIWLLIVQGFSYHVTANKEQLRSMFVSFEGKEDLIIHREDLTPQSAKQNDWIGIIDEFVQKISEKTKGNITTILEPKFSTTNQISYTAEMIRICLFVDLFQLQLKIGN